MYGGVVLNVLNHETRRKQAVNLTARPLYVLEIARPLYFLEMSAGIHWMGCSVGLCPCLGSVEKRNNLASSGIESRFLSYPAHSLDICGYLITLSHPFYGA